MKIVKTKSNKTKEKENPEIQSKQVKRVDDAKRGKICASESRLVLAYF